MSVQVLLTSVPFSIRSTTSDTQKKRIIAFLLHDLWVRSFYFLIQLYLLPDISYPGQQKI